MNKNIKVELYCQKVLETVELPISDAQAFIDLVKDNGYEDGEGERYHFIEAKIEYREKAVIYLYPDSGSLKEE